MSAWRAWFVRVASLFVRGRRERELALELESHFQLHVDESVRAGLSPADARRAALIKFGSVESVKDAYRDRYGIPLIADVSQDCRAAWRTFRRAPWFFAGLTLTLALGVGANGAVFSIARAVLLRPLPYAHPSELVMVWRTPEHPPPPAQRSILTPVGGRGLLTGEMAFGLRGPSRLVLSEYAAIFSWDSLETQFDLALVDRTERLRGAAATPNFFEVLGVEAAKGRVFTSGDEGHGESLVVLSYGLWRRAFGGDASIIGRPITLVTGRSSRGPKRFVVIGVLPRAFRFTYPHETEAWTVEPWSEVAAYGAGLGFRAVGRLQRGLTVATANVRLAPIRIGLDRVGSRPETREAIRMESITDSVVGETRPSMLLLAGVALLLLLITCATVANALFVRVADRQRELAVRASLGASQRRLVHQFLAEGVLLSVGGTATGTVVALALQPVLRALVPATVPRADEISIDLSMLAFAAAAASVVTIVATLAPAWRGARVDLMSTLRRASNTVSTDRSTVHWRQGLVGLQAAIATTLLIGASLLLMSFWRLNRVPLGFDGQHVVTMEMRLLDEKYRSRGAIDAFQRDLLTNIRAAPGVVEAGLTSAVPFRGVDFVFLLRRTGRAKSLASSARFVDAAYFSVMRMPILRGRAFSTSDAAGASNVAVISESYARKMFGAEDPIGQMIDYESPVMVIGVVNDVRYEGFDKDPYPAIYLPSAQWPSELICLVVRAAPGVGDLQPAIRAIVHDLDPTLPAMNFTTVDRILDESVADRRFYTTATTAFAAIALLLTAVGLIMIVTRAVIERRRELAIRAALGATSTRLVGLVVKQALRPVVAGVLSGLGAAFVAATWLTPFLFQVSARAPMVYGQVAALVGGVGLLAALFATRTVVGVPSAALLRAE